MKTTTILLLLIIALSSCKKTPECETDNTGKIKIMNHTNNLKDIGVRRLENNSWVYYLNFQINPNDEHEVALSADYQWYIVYYNPALTSSQYNVEQCGEYTLNIQ